MEQKHVTYTYNHNVSLNSHNERKHVEVFIKRNIPNMYTCTLTSYNSVLDNRGLPLSAYKMYKLNNTGEIFQNNI